MAGNLSFEKFREGLSDRELELFIKCAKKRRLIYFIVYLFIFVLCIAVYIIPTGYIAYALILCFSLIMSIIAGLGTWANNIVCFTQSQGRRNGGFFSVLWCLFGGIVIPFIVVLICKNVCPFKSVLGWDEKKYCQSNCDSVNSNCSTNGELRLIDKLLDPNNVEPITIIGNDGIAIDFKQLAVIPYYVNGCKTMYVILKPIGNVEGIANDEAGVFKAVPQDDGDVKLFIEENKQVTVEVFAEFKRLVNN